MEKFELSKLFTIKGIAAPSGLLYSQNVLFVISDSSQFLYQYDIEKKLLLKFPLVKEAKENIIKEPETAETTWVDYRSFFEKYTNRNIVGEIK